jgi:hypothetical protein
MVSPLASALAFAPQFQGQPIAPQLGSPATNKVNIAPTDVTGAYKLSTDAAMQQYMAKLQQQNAMFGGLAGIGGAALLGGPSWLKMFGNGAKAAGGIANPVDVGSAATYAAPGADAATTAGTGSVTGALEGGVGGIGSDYAATAGTGSVADALGGAGATGLADAGGATVAGTLGADAALAGGADAAAAAGGMTLADLLPFLAFLG